jgi:enoyl-CoA hydratase
MCAGDGGAVIWPQLIGVSRARIPHDGELITAVKAVEIGLINHAVPVAELDAFAKKLAPFPPRSRRW